MKSISTLWFGVLNLVVYAQSPTLVIPKGHTAAISSSACSKDGKYLLTGCRDLSAKLWDLKSNEMITYPSQNEVQAVDISPDSKFVLIGSADNNLRLFNVTGELVKTLSNHKNFINSVAFSPGDNQYFASASEDGTVNIYNLEGKKIKTIELTKAVNSICFNSIGNKILTACSDHTAVLWNLAGSKERTFNLVGHKDKVNQAKISKDGNWIVTCSDDKTSIVWDKNGLKNKIVKHSDRVTTCDISSDNQTIVSGSYDGEIIIWNVLSDITKKIDTKSWGLSSISILPDGKSFIVTTSDQISQWSMNGNLIRIFEGKAKVVTSVCLAKDVKSIIQGDNKGWIKIWDGFLNSFKSYHEHEGAISSIASSPDSNHLATGGEDKNVLLWNKSGKVEKKITLDDKVTSLSFSKDGKTILAGCYSGCTVLWDIDGSHKKIIKQNGDQISCAAFAPDGNSIVTSSLSNKIEQFDLKGNKIKTIKTPSAINCLTYTSDSKSVIAGYFNGISQEWDLQTAESMQNIGTPNGDEVLAIASSPDYTYIAIGKNSGSIELFNKTTNSSTTFLDHTTKILSLNFSADNKMLISGSVDGTVKIWDCKTAKEIATLIALDTIDWVIKTPSGLFDASPAAMLKLKYRTGLEMIDLDQLKERYYEPGLLATILKIIPTSLRDVSTFNSVQLYPEIDAKFVGDELQIKLKARSGELGKLSVFINDKEVMEDANPERKENIKTINISEYKRYFTDDTNRIVLRTFNKEGWLKSPPYEVLYNYKGSKGKDNDAGQAVGKPSFNGPRHLYAIIVGTSDYSGDKLDLIFPDKDAKSFADALKQVGERLFEDRVHISVLTSKEANEALVSSKKNIEKAFNEIAKKASSEDLFIVYLSGHGTTYGDAEKSQFYYLTKDIKSDNLAEKDIRDAYTISSDDLTKWLTANPTRRQVVILDACHSGEVVKSLESIGARELSPSQIKAFERMKDRTGIFILTGSAGDKVSYESSQFGQGLLTYSLLQGMSGQALTEDKRVDIAGLFNFSRDRVPELATYINKIQKPVFVAPHGASSFDIGISDKKVKIELAQPKPIFIQNTFQNINLGMDDIELMSTMKEYLQSLALNGSSAPIVYSDVDSYPNAYKMGGLYTVEAGKISINVNVIKNKQKISTIKHEGLANDLKGFAEALFEKVFKEIQGK